MPIGSWITVSNIPCHVGLLKPILLPNLAYKHLACQHVVEKRCCGPSNSLASVYCLAGLSVGNKSTLMCLMETGMCALLASTRKGEYTSRVHTSIPGMPPTHYLLQAAFQYTTVSRKGSVIACLLSVGMARLTISKPVELAVPAATACYHCYNLHPCIASDLR